MNTLGKYEILDTLGSGGMGTVYRARDPVLEREVAIKVISTAGGPGEVKERFYREARACAQLQHPHIVAVYDLGEQDDQAYIVMELLVGADLKRIIGERRPLPLEAKIELALQVLEGLGHAHRHGIVHRDIKPGNIFVHQDNCAKILDFGIARVPFSRLTLAGSALGTPEYMAPEQIAGQVCDARSDLFSMALVFFEFLSYVHPFPGSNAAGRIVTEQPASLCAANPELPAWLEPVILRGLEKTPGRRYQTAEEFATALRVGESGGIRPRPKAPALPFTLPSQGARPGAAPLASAAAAGAGAPAVIPARKTGPLPFALPRKTGLNAAARPPAPQAQGPGPRAGAPQVGAPEANAVEAKGPSDPGNAPAPQRWEPLRAEPFFTGGRAAAAGSAAEGRAIASAKEPSQVAPQPTPRSAPEAEQLPRKALVPRVPPLTPPEGAVKTVKTAAAPAATPPPHAIPAARPSPRMVLTSSEISPARRWALASVGMGVLIVAALIGHSIRSATRLRPAAASAEVLALSSRVLASPDLGAKEIVPLKRGDRVNILHPPTSRDQQWVEVQLGAAGKAYAPGFVRVADLGDWSSDKPDTALYLLQLFSPADSAPDPEIQAQLEKLDAFASRFGSTPQGPLANFERARLNVLLAERGKQAGEPGEIWQQHLDAATVELAMAAAGADLGAKVESVRQQLEALKEKQ